MLLKENDYKVQCMGWNECNGQVYYSRNYTREHLLTWLLTKFSVMTFLRIWHTHKSLWHYDFTRHWIVCSCSPEWQHCTPSEPNRLPERCLLLWCDLRLSGDDIQVSQRGFNLLKFLRSLFSLRHCRIPNSAQSSEEVRHLRESLASSQELVL